MINTTDPVYIVKLVNIYDIYNNEYIIGVASSREHAIEIIKSHIKGVDCSYKYHKFLTERWLLNERLCGGTTETFTKEQNIEWAKELGVYHD